APGGYHTYTALDFPVSLGKYRFPSTPQEPTVLFMLRTPCSPGLPMRDQYRAGRVELMGTPFEKFERNIRDQLGRMLGGAGLDPARDKGLGVRPAAILNRDDQSYNVLKAYCRVPVLDYGIDKPAAVRAVDVQLHAHSTSFHLILPTIEMMVETQLVGRFNVSNCLAAIATAYSLGVPPNDIVQRLAKVTGVTGRMESIHEGQPFSVIVDFAHTPDSLEKVLATLRPLTAGRLMAVFGSPGGRDSQKRPIMGRIAAQMTDFFVITNDDPREEDPEAILHDIAQGAEEIGKRQGQDFFCILDRTQAIATAFAHAQSGDTVLLAGKGHEQCIIVGREKMPWDDRRVAREQIRMLENSAHE
ncbi:MAG: Mur ligase family protein, partial [Ktedonobacteraceae bacterium]